MALSQQFKLKLKFHAGVKKCHFGNFSERAGMAVPCQCGPQEFLTGIQKFFLFWVPINPQKDWKVKLESAHFSRVQSGKTTVCVYLSQMYTSGNDFLFLQNDFVFYFQVPKFENTTYLMLFMDSPLTCRPLFSVLIHSAALPKY